MWEALDLDNVIVLDIETTGLDPSADEILELGMIRLKAGRITERYSQLFRPQAPIPRFITQLTGIHQSDCEDAPFIGGRLQEIADFWNGACLVAHNASFDMSFLRNAFRNQPDIKKSVSLMRILDTLEMSRILLPYAPNHKLGTLAALFGINTPVSHRALADAETTTELFLELVRLSAGLDKNTLSIICRLLAGTDDGPLFLYQALNAIAKNNKKTRTSGFNPPQNILGNYSSDQLDLIEEKIDVNTINRFFEPDGKYAALLNRYERRKPQIQMACLAARVFNQDGFLLAEAETGVGKSMAYLLPAVLWTQNNSESRVVISTNTKTLQDQLFQKELPLLSNALDHSFSAVLLKGRDNYICLKRWQSIAEHTDLRMPPSSRRRLLPLALWVNSTITGDIEENSGFSRENNKDMWTQLSAEGRHCQGPRCSLYGECFYQRIRRASRKADIILVNHALLFSDMAAGHSVLGNYDCLIADEAHQLERVASDCLARKLNVWTIREWSHALYRKQANESGLLVYFENSPAVRMLDEPKQHDFYIILDQLKQLAEQINEEGSALFKELADYQALEKSNNDYGIKRRFKGCNSLFGPLKKSAEELAAMMGKAFNQMPVMTALLCEAHADDQREWDMQIKEMDFLADRLFQIKMLLEHFLENDFSGSIVWAEQAKAAYESVINLYSVPLDIARLLADLCYPNLKRCILTSATLSIAGNFSYIRQRLGLNALPEERLTVEAFGSPFDYKEQALTIVPGYLPLPNSRLFKDETSCFLKNVLITHPRGTMVLFTSKKMLKDVYHDIQPAMQEAGIRLMGQGIDGSRSQLLKYFQEDTASVLFGTMSFWEGVDVPGSALELLVITKLPFDVPSDPLVEARSEQAETNTGNGFMNYNVPEAIVKFRQGFGRLIRSGSDKGAVIVLDNRITQTRYGRLFFDSLPVSPKICRDQNDVGTTLENWFNS